MSRPVKSSKQINVEDAERIIREAGKNRIIGTFRRLASPIENERNNAARILRRDDKIPKSLINYVASMQNQDAADTAIIMIGDILDPRLKKVRGSMQKEYNHIKEKYRGRESVKTKAKKITKKAPKDKTSEFLMKKRGFVAENDTEMEDKAKTPIYKAQFNFGEYSYSFSKETLDSFQKAFNNAVNEAEQNPEGMDEERLNNLGKTLISYDLGVNVDIYKEILKNIRDAALDFATTQKACNEVTDCANELRITNLEDVNGISAGLCRFLAVIRSNNAKLTEEMHNLASNNNALTMEVAQLSTKLSKAETDAGDLNIAIRDKNTQLADLVGKLKGMEAEYNRVQADLRASQRKISETEDDYEARLQKKREEALVLQQQYGDLEVEKKKLERERENAKIELGEKEEEAKKLRSQLVIYEGTNQDLVNHDLQKANRIEKLNEEIAGLNSLVSSVQQQLAFKEDEYNELAKIKDKEIQDLQLEKQRWLGEKAEMDSLASKNAELEAQVESLTNQKDSLQESIKEKDKANAVLRAKGVSSAEAQEELNKAHINAKAVIKDLNNQINELKEQIKLNDAKNTEFKAKYEELSSKSQTTEKELENAKQINQIMKNEYNDVKNTLNLTLQKAKGLEVRLSSEAKARMEVEEECQKAKIRAAQAEKESLAIKKDKDKASADILKLESDLKAIQDLKESSFIVQPSIQDEQGDVEMKDAQVEISSVLLRPQEEVPLPLNTIKLLLGRLSTPKRRNTAPTKQPPSLAEKKRALNKTGGAYLVGGRPDPEMARGGKFWKNAYNKGFKLF